MRKERYDIARYPFRMLIEDALGHKDLEQLHTYYDYEPFTMENNSDTCLLYTSDAADATP